MILSLEDCIALSSLTEEEIAAIAEHEHLPMIVAAELGNYLVQTPEGTHSIKKDDQGRYSGRTRSGRSAACPGIEACSPALPVLSSRVRRNSRAAISAEYERHSSSWNECRSVTRSRGAKQQSQHHKDWNRR
jgi:hypothetical protein